MTLNSNQNAMDLCVSRIIISLFHIKWMRRAGYRTKKKGKLNLRIVEMCSLSFLLFVVVTKLSDFAATIWEMNDFFRSSFG